MSELVTIERDGKKYCGEFSLTGSILTVTAMYGSKQAHSESKSPKGLAIILLGELVDEGKATDSV